ncbi:hypothetical protein [Gordonia sp. 852002-50395_SCH5434458]|uniref:hypothetical protein n=1 Tax=Gordonia sp. 852002-50395_SCH5434458 TaxID=1834090 RepID=UPI0007EB9648|nr:hypothetical protein [Gordonia sp. 852002-50395_SCH5434458]OBC02717.1 hypothetical protein A5785_02580 [Gordonia sp. 852002-50395_SCH5434458]
MARLTPDGPVAAIQAHELYCGATIVGRDGLLGRVIEIRDGPNGSLLVGVVLRRGRERLGTYEVHAHPDEILFIRPSPRPWG